MTVMKQTGTVGSTSFGDTVTASCVAGYRWVGIPTQLMTCAATGSWNYFAACSGMNYCISL